MPTAIAHPCLRKSLSFSALAFSVPFTFTLSQFESGSHRFKLRKQRPYYFTPFVPVRYLWSV